jgi:hypothetical protein
VAHALQLRPLRLALQLLHACVQAGSGLLLPSLLLLLRLRLLLMLLLLLLLLLA